MIDRVSVIAILTHWITLKIQKKHSDLILRNNKWLNKMFLGDFAENIYLFENLYNWGIFGQWIQSRGFKYFKYHFIKYHCSFIISRLKDVLYRTMSITFPSVMYSNGLRHCSLLNRKYKLDEISLRRDLFHFPFPDYNLWGLWYMVYYSIMHSDVLYWNALWAS